MRGKIRGLVVYVPTSAVSMIDLSVTLNVESENLYEKVCKEFQDANLDKGKHFVSD